MTDCLSFTDIETCVCCILRDLNFHLSSRVFRSAEPKLVLSIDMLVNLKNALMYDNAMTES